MVIGKHCLIAAQVGIAGKTKIGNQVTIYGQVGIAQNIEIGDKVVLLARAGVGKNLEAGKTYFGAPCEEARTMMKEMATVKKLVEEYHSRK